MMPLSTVFEMLGDEALTTNNAQAEGVYLRDIAPALLVGALGLAGSGAQSNAFVGTYATEESHSDDRHMSCHHCDPLTRW